MPELLEIVFEGIHRSKVYQVLQELLERAGGIIEVQCSEAIEISEKSGLTEREFGDFVSLSVDASLLINIGELQINKMRIPRVLMRVVKYGDKFDIDFNFEENRVTGMTAIEIMKEAHLFVTEVSEKYQISHWFGGMEPASDDDTRYFTDKEAGPLMQGLDKEVS